MWNPFRKLSLAGDAYTLSVEGTAALLARGARVVGPDGVDHNTMEHLLGTDSRNPPAKHRILEMYVEYGFEPPDTPVMALHRGRIDLLEAHLARDPDLLTRTFDIVDIFPLAPACTLLLAAIGIYGVASHAVSLRTREIGIRMSLGARAADVLGMFVRETLRLAVIGVGIGLAASAAVSQVLASFLFGLGATDAVTFATAAAVIGVVAMMASYLAARRAARVDPLRALRHD